MSYGYGNRVHKKMLAVVVSTSKSKAVPVWRRMFGSNPEQLRLLAEWLLEQESGSGHGIDGPILETVWEALERYWKPLARKRGGRKPGSGTLHCAGAIEPGPRGSKKDFADAERSGEATRGREWDPELCARC